MSDNARTRSARTFAISAQPQDAQQTLNELSETLRERSLSLYMDMTHQERILSQLSRWVSNGMMNWGQHS